MPFYEPIGSFGTVDNFKYEQIEHLPIFDSSKKSSRFDHLWHTLKKLAKANNWSEDCVKDVLFSRLRGEICDYFLRYTHHGLDELVNILGKRLIYPVTF